MKSFIPSISLPNVCILVLYIHCTSTRYTSEGISWIRYYTCKACFHHTKLCVAAKFPLYHLKTHGRCIRQINEHLPSNPEKNIMISSAVCFPRSLHVVLHASHAPRIVCTSGKATAKCSLPGRERASPESSRQNLHNDPLKQHRKKWHFLERACKTPVGVS